MALLGWLNGAWTIHMLLSRNWGLGVAIGWVLCPCDPLSLSTLNQASFLTEAAGSLKAKAQSIYHFRLVKAGHSPDSWGGRQLLALVGGPKQDHKAEGFLYREGF